MYKKFRSFLIVFTVLVISCKNQNNGNELHESKEKNAVNKENVETNNDTLNVDKIKITEQLQGKWREIEYPYRTAEFLNSTVKFVEEGTENKPKFEKFEVGRDCQFANNNIKDLKSETIILILSESNRCEKLKVSNNTLILNGYSTNTNKDYNIVYLKSKE